MTKPNYPLFLSGKPTGKDELSGGSHKKTAKIITDTIKSKILEKRVIGLEGEWGSGKSNVIKIIQKNLGDQYYTFIFDSWGNQEDLTRKSFLEQLIGQLLKFGFLANDKKWLKLENQLLSKTSTIHKQKFPKVKPYWVLLTFSILFFTGLSSLYNNVLTQNQDLIPFIKVGPVLKPLITIYLIPLALVFWAIGLGIIDFLKMRQQNAQKEVRNQEDKWSSLGKIFYWFNGQEIDTEEVETVLEEEPSVKKFREYFAKIEKDLQTNNKNLVIVFDNIDRLEADKVKSLWSSIHTFFAEDSESVFAWIIVPYDKKVLQKHFGNNGFIEKTFAINFRITPPIVTQWEAFLQQSIEGAFGKEIIPKKEKEYIVKLFDILFSSQTIKPRQIINYVNDLVAQYLQWEQEVLDGEIKMRYLALFVLVKDQIINNPNEEILSREYLKGAVHQFENVAELDESISALTFGVEKKLANEVLLFRELQTIFREGDTEKLKNYSNHTAFDNYFYKAYFSLEILEKIEGLTSILEAASPNFSDNRRRQYWNDFAKQMDSVEIGQQFERFNDNHKAILINSPHHLSKKVLLKLINHLRDNIQSDEQINQNIYYEQLFAIETFLKAHNDIEINLLKNLKPIKFKSVPFIDLVSELKSDYSKYKITTDVKELTEYFFKGKTKDILDLDRVAGCLKELSIIKNEYKLEILINAIIASLEVLVITQKEELKICIDSLKLLENKPLKLKLTGNFYNQLTNSKIIEDDIFVDALSIGIADLKEAIQYPNFKNLLVSLSEVDIEKVCDKIEWYISYGDLLMLIVLNRQAGNFLTLKSIAKKLTYKSYGISRLNIQVIFNNYSQIISKVFDNNLEDENHFLNRINAWKDSVKKDYDITNADRKIFSKLNRQDLQIIEVITEFSLNRVENLSKEEVLMAFKEVNKDFAIIEALTNNNLIRKFSNNFYSAFDDYYKDLVRQKGKILDSYFWDLLTAKLSARKLISTFTGIREIIINDRGELNAQELKFFGKGLIAYGNLKTKPNHVMGKLIIPMIKSDINFPIFLDNNEKLIPIINISSEHKDMAISELSIRYNSNTYKDDLRMKEIGKVLKLKKDKL